MVGFLVISSNAALTNLDGLAKLASVWGFLVIAQNADLINLDQNVGKLYEQAKEASGVSGTKKLSGAYAANMNATSSKPMSLTQKCDVQATIDASANGQIAVGIPVGMEGLF